MTYRIAADVSSMSDKVYSHICYQITVIVADILFLCTFYVTVRNAVVSVIGMLCV